MEKELERLNSVLTKLRQSDARYKTLVTMKFVSVPLVAFASCIAGIGGIVSATGRAQLALAVLGLIAAFAAFVLSFLDGTIALQLQRTMNRIAKANKASARFEGTA
ncbi:hypothetical protein BD410DRAFT_515664 [Rickenella mellea]|uniref:Uncharacterized protein n=1 Tax=Rickenella mellea TaxID=50990 RepID=A0A4Y7PSB3_9AGAM|nr:hypothetical protein BD410DRAFT_515664 [Rickenella mellea]